MNSAGMLAGMQYLIIAHFMHVCGSKFAIIGLARRCLEKAK